MRFFAHYAKKNLSYLVETTLADKSALFKATILWENALLARRRVSGYTKRVSFFWSKR